MSESWQDVRPEDLEAVVKALSSGSLSVVSGGLLERFERKFAKFAGCKLAVAFNNGTAAIHAALRACQVGPGDDVLMCDYGFHGMAAAVLACGARIVPVDCRADSLCMDPEDLVRARTPQSKAVLIHNPWGMPADFEALRQAAGDLRLISDASHAHGATYKDQPMGHWADITCYSLGYQKLISGGELGCSATDDPELRDRMVIEGHVNRVPRDLKTPLWSGNAVGLKMRPHPAAMVLASAQMGRYPEKLEKLRATCRAIETALEPLGLVGQSASYAHNRVWWRTVMQPTQDATMTANQIYELISSIGLSIEPNHYLPALQHQEIFQWPRHRAGILARSCPTVERLGPILVTLPALVEFDGTNLPKIAFSEHEGVQMGPSKLQPS